MPEEKHEDECLRFWDKHSIYEQSRKKNSKGKKFYFMDGPPYATGHIHMGTALNKILKDIAMRSRRLQGYDVFDRPGYDTHGVPIEFQVEKEIGSKSKHDIEKYGVEKFIAQCKAYATQYIGVMNEEFKNLGIWMDWDNPYLTLSDDYIEAIWAAFKEADKKGLLYLGKYPVHICPRCETAVAFNEIEYGKQKDTSIYVKFPVKNKKASLIIWTTTPWTLPANTGVMVNPDVIYQGIEVEGEKNHWIIAKDLVEKVMKQVKKPFKVVHEIQGKELEGWEYENPLAPHLKLKIKNGYKVVLSARYVTTEDGTGLVHCAPGHGKEDYEVGKEYALDAPSPVTSAGILTEEAGKYEGKKAREVDKDIIEDLKHDGFLVHSMVYEHDYPLCWRDKTPLLMISQPQWFLKISGIQKKLLEENEKNTWIPSWVKLRMKAWLEGISDWPVSRQRYWGTPLPIWINESTGEKVVVGSLEELRKLSGKKTIDVHKPGIDRIELKGKKGTLKRVNEVLDVWFDSGVSSWAALGYPAQSDKLKKYWPADVNIEGKDQIRGWWNSQFILSQILFGKKPFDAILMHGLVLDISKKKMSKSLGNAVSPQEVIKKYSRDHMRYYFAKLSKGEDFSYDEKEFQDIQKVFMVLSNIHAFASQIPKKKAALEIEDRWILSRFHSLVKEVTAAYNNYRFPEAVEKLENFLVHELSRTYIQMIRERSDEVHDVIYEILIGLVQLLAPIIPFMTERLWQDLRGKKMVDEESIHLSVFPKADSKKISEELEKEFEYVLRVIKMGLAERDKAKIGLRWPLGTITIHSKLKKPLEKFEEVIKSQLNVKKVVIAPARESDLELSLDTTMTRELEAEGYARELARKVQAERKNAGLQKGDLIDLKVYSEKDFSEMIASHKDFLKERTNSRKIDFIDGKVPSKAIVFTIRERKLSILFS
ncbi:isoleucine--tRNA ligase [Candidatus Pacearchaeota archaeon]|nr:isoleucine--tRNA ligase [Candidatus Pacearchaeota archaeon]